MNQDKQPILQVRDLKVHFPVEASILPWKATRYLKAVDGITFDLHEGETLGIVGESGCGKSSMARGIIGLNKASSGKILWEGKDLACADNKTWNSVRKDIQMIFQDPVASLNPRMTIGQCISEPLINFHPELSKDEVKKRVREIMDKVGLLPNVINRYPHEFSGGQCQRVGIARALITKPKLIICDEPVSALDVSIQAQVINLLKSLQKEMNLSLLFIAHDLSVVKHISDRVLVMYLGNQMELARPEQLYDDPKHPYTKALLTAIPIPDPKKEKEKVIQLLEGDLPSPINPPSGCVFRTRCPSARERCSLTRPEIEVRNHRAVACLRASL